MTFEVDWVDAFADAAFSGNGCAVVHGGASLDDDTCMAFVRETSLVECTFTGPSDVADIHVRYFLASREIPFAGHPTVATIAAMRARGFIQDGMLTMETLAGVLSVEVDGTSVRMTQNAPEFGAQVDPVLVATAMGVDASDIIGTPQIVSTGLPFCITVLRDRNAVRSASLNLKGLTDYAASIGQASTDIMEPYLITLQDVPQDAQTFGRLLLAPPSAPEDPFTGSATGAAASYLWQTGLIDGAPYVAAQGDDMGRPGRADVRLLGKSDDITGVVVGGKAHILISGTLNL
ncbi:MAG: PhzF family phenazine biosynthesis protein [Paracoccaceae bacterium]